MFRHAGASAGAGALIRRRSMANPPTLYVVCSDRDRNGKTLLARVLVDFLLMEERDPFCFDLDPPLGPLRGCFPGRTALVDFTTGEGRAKVFDTLIARAGRDYVIDLPAQHLARLCEEAGAQDLTGKLHAKGCRLVVLYIVDREAASLDTAVAVEEVLQPDLFVPVSNAFIGSALPEGLPGPVLTMKAMGTELAAAVSNRRLSLRLFMLGDEEAVPVRLRGSLKGFLHGLVAGMRDFEPAMSLQVLRETELSAGSPRR